MSTLIERIDERIKVLGTSRRKVSIEAGLSPDYIRDLARKPNPSPALANIEKLAERLETTVEWLRSGGEQQQLAFGIKPPPPLFGPDDLPVFRSVEGGPGEIVVPQKPIAHVSRPAKLANNPDAFAVVVSGESMSPEYEAGDMLFVDPYRPLVRDRNFVFVDDTHGDWRACVKRLKAWDDEEYQVFQHNPPKGQKTNFSLRRAEWPKAMRVVGKYDRD